MIFTGHIRFSKLLIKEANDAITGCNEDMVLLLSNGILVATASGQQEQVEWPYTGGSDFSKQDAKDVAEGSNKYSPSMISIAPVCRPMPAAAPPSRLPGR